MAQPSVAQYFNTRKRPAIDSYKIDCPRKVLKLEQEETNPSLKDVASIPNAITTNNSQMILKEKLNKGCVKTVNIEQQNITRRTVHVLKQRKCKKRSTQDIQDFLNSVRREQRCVTPPNQPEKKINPELDQVKKVILKSSKLNELKESINRFKKSADQLKVVERKTADVSQSPKLKTFKSIEFEVSLSPQKSQSPEKPYLSPKKESSVRRNLLNALSPIGTPTVKNSFTENAEGATKPSLQLPFKYRTLNELFRSTDTVAQILYNRKELVTFKKLKPAVEEMVKRTFLKRHLAQIKFIYADAYDYTQEKLKAYGTGLRQIQWELVLSPKINNADIMTTQVLLDRRRKFHELLIDRIKDYHNEFLLSLTPSMVIPKDTIKRWHPEFDIEKVPEIELAELPQPPLEETFTSGKQVLEKARQMFNCNTRMDQALLKLKEIQEGMSIPEQETIIQTTSTLKGIPKALLEKVRQRQAAKAVMSMTRTVDKEKELQMYSRLPEIARLTRNLFVTEKKGVLELDIVLDKLGNSHNSFLNKIEIQEHLEAISKEVPGWLVFHKLRSSVFLKLAKNSDLSVVLNKLEKLAKQKAES